MQADVRSGGPRYSSSYLRSMRNYVDRPNLDRLYDLGILRHRGSRAGRHVQNEVGYTYSSGIQPAVSCFEGIYDSCSDCVTSM